MIEKIATYIFPFTHKLAEWSMYCTVGLDESEKKQHQHANYKIWWLTLGFILCACFGSSGIQAQQTGNFALNVFYQNPDYRASCGQSNDSSGFDLAKRHGWLYSGYMFHMLLNGLDNTLIAQPAPANQDNLFGISECDDSYCYMQRTFGYMPGLFYVDGSPSCSYGSETGTSAKAISNLMRLLNYGLFSVMMILTSYAIIQGVLLGAAQEGSLTQKLSLLAASRICIGSALIVPQPDTGYSTIQVILMYVVMTGVGLADRAFSGALDAFMQTGYVFTLTDGTQAQTDQNDKDSAMQALTKTAFDGQTSGTTTYEGYANVMRRMVCAQYQVYSRMLRENNPSIQYGLESMSSGNIPLSMITSQTTSGSDTIVTFGDQGGDSDYQSWCGQLSFPSNQAGMFNNILSQFNANTFVLYQNAITYSKNFRLNQYDPGDGSRETQYQTCLGMGQVVESQYIERPSIPDDGSTTPSCAASNGKAPTFKDYNVANMDCSDPGIRPKLLNMPTGALQGEILQPLIIRTVAWQGCSNQGSTVTLGSAKNDYSGCVSNVANNLSNLLTSITNDYSYDSNSGDVDVTSFMLKVKDLNTDGLLMKSIGSSGNTNCKSSTGSCYEYNVNQQVIADSQNGTAYSGDQYDLVKAYRLIDPAFASKSSLGTYGFNNIRQAILDYNTPATTTQAVDPTSYVNTANADGKSALDIVTKNLLGPLFNDFDSAMKPTTGFLLTMFPDWFPPSVTNFKQSVFMVLERLFGFYYFDKAMDESQYFDNWFKSQYKSSHDRCKNTFNDVCSSADGCFKGMQNAGCIRNGGLLGAANSVMNEVNYNPFSDFVQTGITVIKATGYYIMYNNIDLFIANAAATAIYFGLEVVTGLVVSGLKVLWSFWGPNWMEKLAASALEIPFTVVEMFKNLDMQLSEYYTTLCSSLIFIMLPFGFMMGILIPFYPILIFVTAAFGWFASVLEGIIAAPLVAIGLAHPSYHDVMGKSTQSVLLMFSLFLQPIMLVFGVFVSIIVLNVMIIFFNTGFLFYLSMLFDPSGGATSIYTNQNSDVMLFITIGLVYVYTMTIWEVTSKSCMGIVMLNDRVMRWMDSNFQPQSGAQMAQQMLNAAKEGAGAVGDASKSGMSAVNEKAAKGATELAKSAMKVAATIPNAAALAFMKNQQDGKESGRFVSSVGAIAAFALTVGREDKGAVMNRLKEELGQGKDAKTLGQLAAPHAAVGKALKKAENALNKQYKLREKAKVLDKQYKGQVEAIKQDKAGDTNLNKLKGDLQKAKDKLKETKKTTDQQWRGLGGAKGRANSIKSLEGKIRQLEGKIQEAERPFNEAIQKAREEAVTELNKFEQQYRIQEANNDPRALSEVTGPDAPKLGNMTIGELNTRIMDMTENKEDVVIRDTADMVAARAAGYSWDEVFAKVDDGKGNIGVTGGEKCTENVLKMVNEAAKVNIMSENTTEEGRINFALNTKNVEGRDAADKQTAAAYKDIVRNADNSVNNDNVLKLMKSNASPSLLRSVGLSAAELKEAVLSDPTSRFAGYLSVNSLIDAGYKVNDIYDNAMQGKDVRSTSNPFTTVTNYYSVKGEKGIRGQPKMVTKGQIAEQIVQKYMSKEVRVKVFNPLKGKMVTAKYDVPVEDSGYLRRNRDFFQKKHGVKINYSLSKRFINKNKRKD